MSNIILHIAAFISPEADKQPKFAWGINYLELLNIVNAIKAHYANKLTANLWSTDLPNNFGMNYITNIGGR